MTAPTELSGVPLGESGLRAEYKVTVVCVKQVGKQFTYADRDTMLHASDLIVVAGHREDVNRFADPNR
jgi:trk system potassium uptake protein TrkA